MKLQTVFYLAIAVGVILWIYSKWSSMQYKSGETQIPLPDPADSGEGTIDISSPLRPAAVSNLSAVNVYGTMARRDTPSVYATTTRPETTGVVASRDAIAIESTGITPASVVGIPVRQINQVVGPNVALGNAFSWGNPNTSANALRYFGFN